jgi:hypothetical protein
MNNFGGFYQVELHKISNNRDVKIVTEKAGNAAVAGIQAMTHNPGWSTYGFPTKIG